MNWERLSRSEDWKLMWTALDSPVRNEIEILEKRLRDPYIKDIADVQYARGRLAALRWLMSLPERQLEARKMNPDQDRSPVLNLKRRFNIV